MIEPGGRTRLFYYNHSGSWGEHGVYMATSADGIHFGPGQRTALTNPVEVRRLARGGSAGLPIFLATMSLSSAAAGAWGGKSVAYFATSHDGLHWRWPLQRGPGSGPMPELSIGLANESDCACPGQGSFLADRSGFLEVTGGAAGGAFGVQMFVGNGRMGKFDGGRKLGCYAAEEDSSPFGRPNTTRM